MRQRKANWYGPATAGEDPHALIIGGGIAGLTTALVLQQVGLMVRMFEQADARSGRGNCVLCGRQNHSSDTWPNVVHGTLSAASLEPKRL